MDSADLQKNYMGGYNKLMEAYRGSGVQQTIDTMNRAIRDSDNERTREYLLRIQHWNLKVMDLEDVRISLNTKLKHLLKIIDILGRKRAGLHSITDMIDTTTPQGRLFFNISASLAEFEKDLIRERTQAGLAAARARGRKGGRRRGMSKEAEQKAILAETYYREGKMSVNGIAKEIGMSKMTLYKYLRYRNVPIGTYSNNKMNHSI